MTVLSASRLEGTQRARVDRPVALPPESLRKAVEHGAADAGLKAGTNEELAQESTEPWTAFPHVDKK